MGMPECIDGLMRSSVEVGKVDLDFVLLNAVPMIVVAALAEK